MKTAETDIPARNIWRVAGVLKGPGTTVSTGENSLLTVLVPRRQTEIRLQRLDWSLIGAALGGAVRGWAMVDIRLMQAAVAVAEELSFSRAAAKLGTTQSAITKQIQDLEDRVGRELFRRNKRTAEVTEAVQALSRKLEKPCSMQSVLSCPHGRSESAEALLRLGKSPYTDAFLVSILAGSGGNVAVLCTPAAKVLVDSGLTTSRAQMKAAIDALGAAPLAQLINTHWHFDHTDGNEWMHGAGAVITAHENTKQRLATAQRIEFFRATFPPSPASALPTSVFSQERRLTVGNRTLLLQHYDPAHTDSDISVRFEDANIIHCGDTFFNGIYPSSITQAVEVSMG